MEDEAEAIDPEARVPGLEMTERDLRLRLVEQAMRHLPEDIDLGEFAGQAFSFVMGQPDRESG